MISAPGAAMLDSKLCVARLDGPFPDLYERWKGGDDSVWVNHARPGGGAALAAGAGAPEPLG